MFKSCIVVLAAMCWASIAQAAFIVEDRSGGLNYANFHQSGWATSSGNVNAPGCTPNIGSMYSGTTVYFGPSRIAVFTYTPSVSDTYDISLAWPNTAGQYDTAVVVYTGNDSGNAAADAWGNTNGPTGVLMATTADMYYKNVGVWNSVGSVAMTAGTTYKVGIYGGHKSLAAAPDLSNRVAIGAVKFEAIPEPATLGLLMLAPMVMIRRRR